MKLIMENWRKYLKENPELDDAYAIGGPEYLAHTKREKPLPPSPPIYDRDLEKIPLTVFEFETMADPDSDEGRNMRAELHTLFRDAFNPDLEDQERLIRNVKAAWKTMMAHKKLGEDAFERIEDIFIHMDDEYPQHYYDRLAAEETLGAFAKLLKAKQASPEPTQKKRPISVSTDSSSSL